MLHYLLDKKSYYTSYLFGLNGMFRHFLFASGINIEQIDYYVTFTINRNSAQHTHTHSYMYTIYVSIHQYNQQFFPVIF